MRLMAFFPFFFETQIQVSLFHRKLKTYKKKPQKCLKLSFEGAIYYHNNFLDEFRTLLVLEGTQVHNSRKKWAAKQRVFIELTVLKLDLLQQRSFER